MTKELTTSLVEELHAWKIESTFNLSREATFWAHGFGEIVRRHYPKKLDEEIIASLTHETGKSRATIFRWVELYDTYPDLDAEIEKRGKHEVSITKMLGKAPAEKIEESPCLHNCPRCCRVYSPRSTKIDL